MPAPLFLSGPCEICGQKTTGRHFGVMSCRACAAFFRRAVNWKNKQVECPTGSCNIWGNGKYPCKKCRLKRCLDVGMDSSKFQSNRDLISCSNKFIKRVSPFFGPAESLSTFLGRPTFLLSCEPDRASPEKTIIDVSYLLRMAEEKFQKEPTFTSSPFQFKNSLEQLTVALDEMRFKKPDQKIQQLMKLGRDETLFIWEQSFLKVVEWFTNFPEFNELYDYIKMEIVQAAWICWTRLEKITETADYQRKRIFSNDVYMCGHDSCVYFGNCEIDLTWCTNYSLEQLEYYIMPDIEENCRNCVQELVDLAPSNIEVNYMLL